MKLAELVQKRSGIIEQMESLLTGAEASERSLDETEQVRWNELDVEQKELETQIGQRKAQDELNSKVVVREVNKQNKNLKMRKFDEVIARSGDKINDFKVRAIELDSNIYDEKVGGGMSVVGYEPFYKSMGVEILPNLTSAIKLPFIGAMKAGKKAEGLRNDNTEAAATVTLIPSRFPITETIGKELLSVGNEQALQSFLMEMVKACDRGITEEIFNQVIATATAVAGLTGYTTDNVDALVGAVDGDVSVLMPRAEFYKAKGVKVDAGSGNFLATKSSSFGGSFWDGTPLFFSNLFAGTSIAAADLRHVTVGEFGDEYEVIFDYTSKAPEGQVVVTVVKIADVKVRNAAAVKKAVIA